MSVPHLRSSNPDYWVGALGFAISEYLAGTLDHGCLTSVYRDLLASPLVDDIGLRNQLREPPRTPRRTATTQRRTRK